MYPVKKIAWSYLQTKKKWNKNTITYIFEEDKHAKEDKHAEDKKYCKGRDNCHYTSDYVCKLTYNVP